MDARHRTFIASLIALSVLGTGGAAAEPFVYVTHDLDVGVNGSVTVIDAATNSVVTTITVQESPRGIALTPDGTRAYVTNRFSDSISVIDTSTNAVTSTIPGVPEPLPIVVSPDGARAYVGSIGGPSDDIFVIDLATNSVDTSISTAVPFEDYFGLDLTADGTRIYAAGFDSETVSVIDTVTNSVIGDPISITRAAATQPFSVAVTPDGTRVYVAHIGVLPPQPGISVIDTATNSEIARILVGGEPIDMAITPGGSRVYVVNSGSGSYSVSVIDTGTNEVIGEPIAVGVRPADIAVTPDGTRLYVTNFADGTVSVIDAATNLVTQTIPVGASPYAIAIGPGPGITVMAADPGNPMTVYAGTAGAGVYRSLDGGTSWDAVNTGITHFDVTALVIASDGSALYAGTRTGGVFKSTDGGASWTAMNDGLDPHILSLEIAPTGDETLFAGVDGGGGVYKSIDGGVTWVAANDGLPDRGTSP